MGFAMSLFAPGEWLVLGLWFLAVIAPILYAAKTRTSIAMGITVSVLLGAVVQVLWSMVYNYGWVEYWVWSDFVLVPARTSEPMFFHTLATAGFLHSQGDMMHVLGNVIILALVGVPLEQRLGSKRYTIIYVIGLLGGSLGWVAFNADSYNPALGASGAAFGLLGAYLAGWPKDEIPFPLLLIRPWPVVFIALLYFGLELVRALATMDSGVSSGIAHMAHIGGFVAAYALLPLVAKGGPVELGVLDGGPSQGAAATAKRRQIKARMVDLSSIDDPWTAAGLDVPKHLREPLKNLIQASDEPETRAAWMDHLADAGTCPVCEAPLGIVEWSTGPHLQCSAKTSHLEWPPR